MLVALGRKGQFAQLTWLTEMSAMMCSLSATARDPINGGNGKGPSATMEFDLPDLRGAGTFEHGEHADSSGDKTRVGHAVEDDTDSLAA